MRTSFHHQPEAQHPNFQLSTSWQADYPHLWSPLRTKVGHLHRAEKCRYCCKSPKLPGDNFLAVRRSDRRPPIYVVSITLPRSPVSLSSGDEVPHIFTRKSPLQPGEFLITSAKRLLQQYRHKADLAKCLPVCPLCGAKLTF